MIFFKEKSQMLMCNQFFQFCVFVAVAVFLNYQLRLSAELGNPAPQAQPAP